MDHDQYQEWLAARLRPTTCCVGYTEPEFDAAEFEASFWYYDETEESEAALPRRPPALRDDDPWCRGTYDRLDDVAFFRENPGKEFRIISPCGGDLRRAKLPDPPEGHRSVYLVRCNSWDPNDALAVCLFWPTAGSDWLNRASDDVLFDIYEIALSAQGRRGGYLGVW